MMDPTNDIVKTIRHDEFEVHLRSDGIVHVHYFKNAKITVGLQRDMIRLYREITDIDRPFIFTGEEFVSITAKARANADRLNEITPVQCSVIIVRNLAQKIIADYYLRFNKPKITTVVFKKFESGIHWIHENYQVSTV